MTSDLSKFRKAIFRLVMGGAACLLFFTAAGGQVTEIPLKITKKPLASPRGCPRGEGRTVVKVTFEKTGKVTAVNTVRLSGCGPFDKSVLSAALKIEFTPATRNGEPIKVVKSVEYTYSIY